jgi:UDPglucose--hexose-1-phosphate uridylyltransferase
MNGNSPHRRLNPLTHQWVLVSPQRTQRPWLGQVEKTPPEHLPAYDPNCYLCPGNARAAGRQNPDYAGPLVFDNDYPALLPPDDKVFTFEKNPSRAETMQTEPAAGVCRVMCFSPRHDLSIPELPLSAIEDVVRSWSEQTSELLGMDFVEYVQIFENKGAMMGCSNPHPHSQIWATNYIPDEPARELVNQNKYWENNHSCLLCNYLQEENKNGSERLVVENEDFVALVPFWATWPFEILLLSRRHVARLPDLTAAERLGLADLLQKITIRYDNLFETSFPYSMGFHQSPKQAEPQPGWHLHAHFYPPLLRSATVRKFMVGFEMLSMPQRDLTSESVASRLRELSAVHYKSK